MDAADIGFDDEASLREVLAWLREHPLRQSHGQGSIQPAFSAKFGTKPQPQLECILRRGPMLYCRWPSGSLKWETESSLTARGFDIPEPVIR